MFLKQFNGSSNCKFISIYFLIHASENSINDIIIFKNRCTKKKKKRTKTKGKNQKYYWKYRNLRESKGISISIADAA